MIAEVIPEVYDASGKKITKPITKRHKWFFPSTYPVGRYLSQPLAANCQSLVEVRDFLRECSYVSDLEQFNQEDYWLPPEEFEKRKKGDCEDFSLWTWRQLIEMGYKTRFVVGRSGKYGEAHAWVTYQEDEKHYLFEPLFTIVNQMPQLSTVRYKPKYSCEWDGKKVSYFVHEDRSFDIGFIKLATLSLKWFFFWSSFWIKKLSLILFSLPLAVVIKLLQPFKYSEENIEQEIKSSKLSLIHHYLLGIFFLFFSIFTCSVFTNTIETATGYEALGIVFFFLCVLYISLFTDACFMQLKTKFKYCCILLAFLIFYLGVR